MEDKRTVLVVEDEVTLAKAVGDALTAHNFNVVHASSVDEAIDRLTTTKHIDAVWLDHYLMGTGNGLDFVVHLKSKAEWCNVPIFIVSNTASQHNVHSYIRLGVTNYYTKADYDIGQIISDLKYTLDNR